MAAGIGCSPPYDPEWDEAALGNEWRKMN